MGVSVPSAPLSIAGDIETTTVADGLALTSFAVTTVNAGGEEVTVPVQIFTVLIGNDPTTRNDFASLADATGGQSFNAANASEVVDALIAAIEIPIAEESPIAGDDTATTKQKTAVNISVLENDTDPDGNTLAIASFTQGSKGLVALNNNNTSDNTADDFLVYTPNPQSDPTLGFIDTFEYAISDGNGGIDTATVTVAVGKIENSGNGKNTLIGTLGDDVLLGDNGKDTLIGIEGDDVLLGGNAPDILIGGLGNDNLTGGNGNDTFGLAAGDGTDLITDFNKGNDKIGLIGSLTFGTNVSTQILGGDTLILSDGKTLARLTGEFNLTGMDFVPLVI